MAADIVLLFRFLESQGYDYWLQKMAYPSFRPPKSSRKFDATLIEKLKRFVEVGFCEETDVIQHLEPYQLRLLSKVEDSENVLPSGILAEYGSSKEETKEETKEEPVKGEGENIAQIDSSTKDPVAPGWKTAQNQPLGYYDDRMLNRNAAQQGK